MFVIPLPAPSSASCVGEGRTLTLLGLRIKELHSLPLWLGAWGRNVGEGPDLPQSPVKVKGQLLLADGDLGQF